MTVQSPYYHLQQLGIQNMVQMDQNERNRDKEETDTERQRIKK